MSISEVLWSWIPTCGWVKTCFFPYRRGVWTSSIAWTHHDRSHESVDPVDAFFLLGSNGVIPMGVPMGVPLYRWMFFLMEHAWKCYKCGDTPQETSICQEAKGDDYMYILYDIYIYIYYVSVTNSKIDLNLKFVTWSARYWYESIHQSYPHIPASMRQCPIRMFFLLTSLLTVNRKLWQFLVLISFSACIYIYIHMMYVV